MRTQGKTGRLSAFAIAKLSNSVSAEITVEVVLAARPDWSRESAAQFLQTHGHVIEEAMATSGTETLLEILPRSSNAN